MVSVLGTMNPTRDGGWYGAVRTESFKAMVRLIPADPGEDDNAPPPFEVLIGSSRVGQAWKKTGGRRKDCLHVVFDDMGLSEPLSGTVVLSQN